MSTSSVIALPDGKGGFCGRYVHFDGYPEGVGTEVAKIVSRVGLDEAVRVLIHENRSWSTIDAGQVEEEHPYGQIVPGYGIAFDYRDPNDIWWTHQNNWCNWAYVLQPEGIAVWENRDTGWTQCMVLRVNT